MSTRNHLTLLLTITFALTASTSEAGFCDWLFGRTTTPYSVGYAPYAAGPSSYAASPAPYAAGYAPYSVGQSYAAGFAPSTAPVITTAVPASGLNQTQMQTYDNPSVYTGRPVVMAPNVMATGALQSAYQLPAGGTIAPLGGNTVNATAMDRNSVYRPILGAANAGPTLNPSVAPTTPTYNMQTSYAAPTTFAPTTYGAATYAPATGIGTGLTFAPGRSGGEVPLGRVLRRANTSSNPFYGTGNVYPNNFGAAPSVPYQAAYPATQAPTTAVTSATLAPSVSPMFPSAPQPRMGGLSRFFGSFMGTRYRDSYYRAPITYYRPMTSVNPVTGTTVTVQQPCSSYVQQLQRTPYNGFQRPGVLTGPSSMGPAIMPSMGATCQTMPQTYPVPANHPSAVRPFHRPASQSDREPLGLVLSTRVRLDKLVGFLRPATA